MNPLVIIGTIIAIAIVITFINHKPKAPKFLKFRSILSGASQVPPVTTKAIGHASLKFDTETKMFTLVVAYEGLVPTAAHVHKGAMGVNGPIVFPLLVGPSPLHYTSRALTPPEVKDLMDGLYYVNLHTATYPDGEIRGQLIH